MKDPVEEAGAKEDFFPTDGQTGNHIVHLNDSTFDNFIAEHAQAPILTMFYAPCKYPLHADCDSYVLHSSRLGCGHCKTLKPELIRASADLHDQQVRRVLSSADMRPFVRTGIVEQRHHRRHRRHQIARAIETAQGPRLPNEYVRRLRVCVCCRCPLLTRVSCNILVAISVKFFR